MHDSISVGSKFVSFSLQNKFYFYKHEELIFY